MNRRKKKPQQVDYAQLVKDKFSEFDWARIKHNLLTQWALLPKLHQRALMVLSPILVLLLVVPFPQTSEKTPEADPQRVTIDRKSVV